MTETLLRDCAAGDAVSGVAGGIGLHVISLGVDDDGGAAVAEKRVGAVAEGNVVVFESGVGFAFHVDDEVLHVAGVVAFGIVEAVPFIVGIEMRAGGFEIGRIALGVLVEVDGVLAGRKIVQVKLEADAWSLLRDGDGADGLALGVLEFDLDFGGAGERGEG